jgi:hypothetical protein
MMALILRAKLLSVALIMYPLFLSAQETPFVCQFNYENGSYRTWVFFIDTEAGKSNIGNFSEVVVHDDTVSVFWESLSCESQRMAPESSAVCQNNYMFIDRRTLEASGDVNGRSFFANCEIDEIEKKF